MFRQILLVFLLLLGGIVSSENLYDISKIDSLIEEKIQKPFNGIILITQNGDISYFKKKGYSDLGRKIDLQNESQFVIGSISKQITAVMILQEYEKGKISLDTPIKTYLPQLTQGWADSVSIHDLLCHTHGIIDFNKPSLFPTGQQYLYSQIGYGILSDIIASLHNDSFANISLKFFKKIGMNDTFHPDSKGYEHLVNSYYERKDGTISLEKNKVVYPAAGGFISTAKDLLLWNSSLYNNELLKDDTFELMKTKQSNAVRNHPIFGETFYGYGITVDTKEDILQLGQTGYAPSSACMNFYFPETKTSVIVLQNIAYDIDQIKQTFYYHTNILNITRDNLIKNLKQ